MTIFNKKSPFFNDPNNLQSNGQPIIGSVGKGIKIKLMENGLSINGDLQKKTNQEEE